jgi:hypothetical protein
MAVRQVFVELLSAVPRMRQKRPADSMPAGRQPFENRF